MQYYIDPFSYDLEFNGPICNVIKKTYTPDANILSIKHNDTVNAKVINVNKKKKVYPIHKPVKTLVKNDKTFLLKKKPKKTKVLLPVIENVKLITYEVDTPINVSKPSPILPVNIKKTSSINDINANVVNVKKSESISTDNITVFTNTGVLAKEALLLTTIKNMLDEQQTKTKMLINSTKKDNYISGDEVLVYKNEDGTIKKATLKELFDTLIQTSNNKSKYDIVQDINTKRIDTSVGQLYTDLNNVELWDVFEEK